MVVFTGCYQRQQNLWMKWDLTYGQSICILSKQIIANDELEQRFPTLSH